MPLNEVERPAGGTASFRNRQESLVSSSFFRLPPNGADALPRSQSTGRDRGFVRNHAATMRLATNEHIPAALSAARPYQPRRQILRAPMRPKKSILCVDSNEQPLSVRKFLLETRGYRVITATSSQQALEILQASIPGTLDLILSDLIMPQMDGNELVRRAKQLHPGLPAMIVSGTVTSFDRAIAADVFLPKGACSASEMLERIRVLVARKRGPKKAVKPDYIAPDFAPASSMSSFAHAAAS